MKYNFPPWKKEVHGLLMYVKIQVIPYFVSKNKQNKVKRKNFLQEDSD